MRKGGQKKKKELNSIQLRQMTISKHILLVCHTGFEVFIKLFYGIKMQKVPTTIENNFIFPGDL